MKVKLDCFCFLYVATRKILMTNVPCVCVCQTACLTRKAAQYTTPLKPFQSYPRLPRAAHRSRQPWASLRPSLGPEPVCPLAAPLAEVGDPSKYRGCSRIPGPGQGDIPGRILSSGLARIRVSGVGGRGLFLALRCG